MYRLALNKTAARSSVRYATFARASARVVSTRPAARSYSSGHSSKQEESSSSPFQIVTYIAPTVLALAAYYGLVEIPNNRAKAAKQAAKQQQEETAPAAEESISEPESSQSEREALPQTPVEATSEPETPATATTEFETVSEDPLPEAAKESIELLSADLEEAIKEGAIPGNEPVEDAAAVEATDAAQAGAFNPDTGEINWDCPCLGGMANGPCGEEFKTAFSCFVYSEAEPKGVDCIEKFSAMQDCFRRHPDVYAEELTDAQPFADENNQGIVASEEAAVVAESSEPASAPSEVAETAGQLEPEPTTTETAKEDN
jgi:intermembrane space import and assembly protein 40